MKKLEMAQRFAEIFAEKVQEPHKVKSKEFIEILTETAWKLADAMQAEADKREDKTRPAVLQEEWQPDWSKAPSWAKYWVQTISGETMWCKNEPIMFSDYVRCFKSSPAPSFGYIGSWQDSLRKRPENGFKRYYGDGLECAR